MTSRKWKKGRAVELDAAIGTRSVRRGVGGCDDDDDAGVGHADEQLWCECEGLIGRFYAEPAEVVLELALEHDLHQRRRRVAPGRLVELAGRLLHAVRVQ